jgi:hypothetical protein
MFQNGHLFIDEETGNAKYRWRVAANQQMRLIA